MRTKSISLALAVALVALLSGCHGSEHSVTGTPNGTGVLTGQVTMVGDLSGQSPAGINVSSSGQVAVTDNAGRFTFVGINSVLPGMITTMSSSHDLKFNFTRDSDGINAQGSVAVNAASVSVQLQKHSATMVATGTQKRELEGKITKIASDSITVNDASTHGDVTAAIDKSTVIRFGNQTLTTNDLKEGDQVHVKAAVQSDGSLLAFDIMKQGGSDNGGGQTKELEGPIVDVSSSSITVHNASTASDVKAKIDDKTIIRKGNTTLKPSDLHKGDLVHVKTTGSGDSLTATEIMLQNPAS